MPLIEVPEHRPEDLAHWRTYAAQDEAWARTARFARRVIEAQRALGAFAAAGRCYAACSWGKDSTVLAHLAWTMRDTVVIPIGFSRLEPIFNPHCLLVRDAFLARWEHPYEEAVTQCAPQDLAASTHNTHTSGTFMRGIASVAELCGTSRYATGIRADESGARRRRFQRFGFSTETSCAPLSKWSARDVFAYLRLNDLPVHPAYAMSYGGRLDRDRIRVAAIGGDRGSGFGRTEWERHYYGIRRP